jgi:2-isopropylmalate synthase
VFGKTWDLHATLALGITLDENLKLISETVRFLAGHGKEVVFDAEHFFDGYIANPDYALRALDAAATSGAHVLCLCDTNGGTLTSNLQRIVADVRQRFDAVIGIHTHNDSDLAVANALAAVEAGAGMVQGCLNGYGERCGNANLASIVANLELKMGHSTIGRERLKGLSAACRFIAETANLSLRNDQPYVGKSAFAHKGGVHVSAVLKDPKTYEHIQPESVGNRQRVLISDLSGRANILHRLKEFGLENKVTDEARRRLLERLKELDHAGYDIEAADGTFELLVRQALDPDLEFFQVESCRVALDKNSSDPVQTTASVTVRAGHRVRNAEAAAHGPFAALHRCLRSCLAELFPDIPEVRVADYKVRLLDLGEGSAGRVRVLIEWAGHGATWSTVGVSDNVVEAIWNALVDAMRLELMRLPAAGVQAKGASPNEQ